MSSPQSRRARIPAAVWVLGCVSMCMDISSELIHSLLPLFMVGTLGASALQVGVIEGLAESTALIVKIFSGVLSDYLGKRKALALLGKLFKQGKVRKNYWAVVEGTPDADEGQIDIPLGKLDETRGWWMKPDMHGQPALTTWKVMGRGNGYSWLTLEPLTGRTHQLRVHCAEMGWPIVGDNIYGSAPRLGGPPLHLHAREMVVPIFKNKPPVSIAAPVPTHMRELLGKCGWKSERN